MVLKDVSAAIFDTACTTVQERRFSAAFQGA
jgi:hypothetical protein